MKKLFFLLGLLFFGLLSQSQEVNPRELLQLSNGKIFSGGDKYAVFDSINTYVYDDAGDSVLYSKIFTEDFSVEGEVLEANVRRQIFADNNWYDNAKWYYKLGITPERAEKYYANPELLLTVSSDIVSTLPDTLYVYVYDTTLLSWVKVKQISSEYTGRAPYFKTVYTYYTVSYDQNQHVFTSGFKYKMFTDDNNFLDSNARWLMNANAQQWYLAGTGKYITDQDGYVMQSFSFIPYSYGWDTAMIINYEYDQNHFLIAKEEYDWDSVNLQWTPKYRLEISYNEDSLLSSSIYYKWDSGTDSWYYYYRKLYTYNENGQLLVYLYQLWDVNAQQWEDNQKRLYTYDEQGRIETYKYWYNSSGQWQLRYAITYDYPDDFITEYYVQTWDYQAQQLVNSYYEKLTFDTEGKLVRKYRENWDSQANDWKPAYVNYYHWTDFYTFKKGIAESKFYPNPASDFVFLPAQKGRVEVFSLDGKKILSAQVIDGKLNVEALRNGIYFLRQVAENQVFTGKIVKE